MTREFLDYIEDVLTSMDKAEKFVQGMSYDDFLADDKTSFATLRALEIIGEAVKKVPPAVRNRYPDIPWTEMAGMRDKLIHDYFGVNLQTVWDTVKKDIPALKPKFKQVYQDYSDNEAE